jgi:hypothetical protein
LRTVKLGFKRLGWLPRNLRARRLWPSLKDLPVGDLSLFEMRAHSQNGEDGILRIIFHKIGVTNKYCVEFGVGDGTECNTRRLVRKEGWSHLHMDCRERPPRGVHREMITAENIQRLFVKYGVPKQFDLLSIDIDSNDYWVWKAIEDYSPRVVVIEYNASIPPGESKTVPYNPGAAWDHTDFYGASLRAFWKLGRSKGYTLVGCDSRGINAFFVRDDLVGAHFPPKDVETPYRPPKYGRKAHGGGHRPSGRRMVDV